MVAAGGGVNHAKIFERAKLVAAYVETVKGTKDAHVDAVYLHVLEHINPLVASVPRFFSAALEATGASKIGKRHATLALRKLESVERRAALANPAADAAAAERMAENAQQRLSDVEALVAKQDEHISPMLAAARVLTAKVDEAAANIEAAQDGRVKAAAETYSYLSALYLKVGKELDALAAVLNNLRRSERHPDQTANLRNALVIDIDDFDDDEALEEAIVEKYKSTEARMRADSRVLIAAYYGCSTFLDYQVEAKPRNVGATNQGRLHNADHKALTDSLEAVLKLWSGTGDGERLWKVAKWAEQLGIDGITSWKARPRLAPNLSAVAAHSPPPATGMPQRRRRRRGRQGGPRLLLDLLCGDVGGLRPAGEAPPHGEGDLNDVFFLCSRFSIKYVHAGPETTGGRRLGWRRVGE